MRNRAREDRQSGIALPMVLAVLVCLLAVSIPFALSMRNQRSATVFRVNRADARSDALLLTVLAGVHLGNSAPDRDPTPYSDDLEELQFDPSDVAQDLGFDDLGPRGRLWSVEVEDLSSRLDLNGCSVYTLARGLGLSSHLLNELEGGEEADTEGEEIRLRDASNFPPSGFVLIDGELTLYGRKEKNALVDLTRPALVVGLWEPHADQLTVAEHSAGTEVIDFRAYLIATERFRANPPYEVDYQALDGCCAVVRYGYGALSDASVQALHRRFRVHTPSEHRRRWVNPQRVLNPLIEDETYLLQVPNGMYYGPGHLVRVTTNTGAVDHAMVLRTVRQGVGFRMVLDVPLKLRADAYEAVVEIQALTPVNVNTCTAEMLEFLLTGLRRTTVESEEVTEAIAQEITARMVALRPLLGPESLDEILDQLREPEDPEVAPLEDELRDLIYANAHHSGELGLRGSAPFTFAADGSFRLKAAASLNYPLSGREKSRSFVEQIVSLAGAGVSKRLWISQRDFEEPWRLNRGARGWTTFPENLDLFHPSEAFNEPPGRVIAENYEELDRFPSQDSTANVGARLAPGRMTGYTPWLSDVTLHFDSATLAGSSPDGWDMADGPPPPIPTNGSNSDDRSRLLGFSSPDMVDIVDDPTTTAFLKPFSVSMWWNPGRSLQDGVLWECADPSAEEWRNRVRLELVDLELRFLVYDGSDGFRTAAGPEGLAGRIDYDFGDGLELLPDTWYHITAFCQGNKPSQMALFVDHKARGTRQFFSRLDASLGRGQLPSSSSGIQSRSSLAVKDGAVFENERAEVLNSTYVGQTRGVVRVGSELIEYTGVSGNTLLMERLGDDPFGGRVARGTNVLQDEEKTHLENTGVELYGYSGVIATEEVPSGQGNLTGRLGQFYVAMVDPQSDNMRDIRVATTLGDRSIGRGLTADENGPIQLVPIDGSSDPLPEDAFPPSGYALLASYRFRSGDEAPSSQPGSPPIPLVETTAGILNGLEVIYYSSFTGDQLAGIERGPRLSEVPINLQGQSLEYTLAHEFVVTTSIPYQNQETLWPVVVMPISIPVATADNLILPRAHPAPAERSGASRQQGPGGSGRGGGRGSGGSSGGGAVVTESMAVEVAQIGLNFENRDQEGTEWVAYNAIAERKNVLVRDDPNYFDQVATLVLRATDNPARVNIRSGGGTPQSPGTFSLWDIANNPTNYAGDTGLDFAARVNRALVFRGVLGTGAVDRNLGASHSGSRVLPVLRIWKRGPPPLLYSGNSSLTQNRSTYDVRPGRYDVVSVAQPNSGGGSFVSINYGWSSGAFLDWNNKYAFVAFDQPLVSQIRGRPQWAIDQAGPGGSAATASGALGKEVLDWEAREQPRIIKFPSGELPILLPENIYLGSRAGGAGESGAAESADFLIDEVRITDGAVVGTSMGGATGSGALEWPQEGRFLLSGGINKELDDLSESEEDFLYLEADAVRLGHMESKNSGNMLARDLINFLPEDAFVLQIGDEVVVCTERIRQGDLLRCRIANEGRGAFGTEAGSHKSGEPVLLLSWFVVSRLVDDLDITRSEIELADSEGFPPSGFVQINQEILGYTHRSVTDAGQSLYIPTLRRAQTVEGLKRGDAAFRGRYGTFAADHQEDDVVFWLPHRYPDWYAEKADIPELGYLQLDVPVRRGFFHSLFWTEQSDEPLAQLIALGRVFGKGSFAGDPDEDPDLFRFDQPSDNGLPHVIDRQGDLLSLRFLVKYHPGAFDVVDFASNAWKKAPLLSAVGVEYLADQVVERHEERR